MGDSEGSAVYSVALKTKSPWLERGLYCVSLHIVVVFKKNKSLDFPPPHPDLPLEGEGTKSSRLAHMGLRWGLVLDVTGFTLSH